MLKSELVDRIAKKFLHLSMHNVAQQVNIIIASMSDTLSKKGRIEIRSFGSFSVRHYPPRQAHNPKTGKYVTTIAKHRPHFKPSKELREQVNF